MNRYRIIERIIRASILILCLIALTANAQVREWTGTTGSWFEPSNWSGGAVPTDANAVEINNDGTAQIFAAGAAADNLQLAFDFGSSGFLEVAGGAATLDVDNSSTIGRSGEAAMSIADGATVTFGDSLLVGDSFDGVASLDVSGSSTSMTVGPLTIGRSGAGTFIGQAGASIATGSIQIAIGADGQLQLKGDGTVLTTSQAMSIDGNPPAGAGNPTLLVSDGAVLNMTSASDSFVVMDQGMARVTGAGSEWIISDFLVLADRANATLNVADAGRVFVGSFSQLGRFGGDVGVVNIGEGAGPGILDLDALVSGSGSGVVNFNHDAAIYHFTREGTASGAPVRIDGPNIAVNHTGPGLSVLAGAHGYNGATTIDAGELRLNGSATSAVTVNSGGRFSGVGSTTGMITVNDNATLAPGDAGPGTLTAGGLTLAGGAQLAYELGDPAAANDRVEVNGDLVLDGTLNVTTLQGFISGTFRLFDYTGTLTDNTLDVAGLPADTQGTVDTSTPGEVNLVVITPEPEIGIDPLVVDFGQVVVGETSAPVPVTITSTGTATLEIDAIDAAAAPFARIGGDCPSGAFILPAGNSCTLDYEYAPVDLVDSMQTINVDSNATAGPGNFELLGQAIAPELTPSPSALDFGDLDIGAPPALQSLQIENTGSGDLQVGALTLTGASADFSVIGNTCTGPLAPGQTCMLEIEFDPPEPGVSEAVLEIDSNDPLAPTLVPLQGSRDVAFADGFESPQQS